MEILNSKNLVDTAKRLMVAVKEYQTDNSGWTLVKEEVQHFTDNHERFTLLVAVKPFKFVRAVESDDVLEFELIQAANDLLAIRPAPRGHNLYEKEIQIFENSLGIKFVLFVAVRQFDLKPAEVATES
jgi:hypothetical protein